MFSKKNFDKQSGIYRSKDRIENFRFRITLKTLHSLIKIPRFESRQTDNQQGFQDDPDEIEFYEFQWQEKRFSVKEVNQYKTIENCKTDKQKKYHQMIMKNGLAKDDFILGKIFSYTAEDNIIPVESMPIVNKKKDKNKDSDLDPSANINDLSTFGTMYIMADLEQETILFIIQWKNGLLIVYPDFNDINCNPYLQEIDSNNRQMYQFSIEHLSENDTHQNNEKELATLSKLSDLSLVHEQQHTTLLFKMPSRRCTNIYLLSEIKSAKNFEYDNIHVRYHVTLPRRYSNNLIVIDGDIEGSTHSSFKCISNGFWRIGYCHELTILCKEDYRFDEFLKISYEIISIDSWHRERTEGYTNHIIPFEAGIYMEKLPCYRDLSQNWLMDEIQRYFIGGRRKINFQNFNGNEHDKVTQLNRYGNQMKSTGFLYVTNQIIHQNPDSLNLSRKLTRSLYHTTTSSLKQPQNCHKLKNLITIDEVISAYRKAKQRLEEATLEL